MKDKNKSGEVRTTLYLTEELHTKLKIYTATNQTSIKDVVMTLVTDLVNGNIKLNNPNPK
jgi:hypothetical protein